MVQLLDDEAKLQRVASLQTLVKDCAAGQLSSEEAAAVLQQLEADAGEHAEQGETYDLFLDALWLATAIDAHVGTPQDKAAQEEASERLTRLGALVQYLHTNGSLEKDTLYERIDPALQQSAGLIEDAQKAYGKREVKFRTGLLYKQQKFNLLREENEGYSKLVAEFDAFVTATGNKPDRARAQRLMANIQSLIGFFDLDPNRVLDILADLAATRLASHWRFLLAFFKNSPWFLHDQQAVQPCSCSADLSGRTGNANAAQIMGFKFAGLAVDDDVQGLMLLMALWIKEGMLKLTDLWPHLSPDETQFAEGKRAYRDHLDIEKDKARGGNTLAMAGSLADDDDVAPTVAKPAAEAMQIDTPAEPVKPVEHRQQLAHALIAVGAIPEVMFLLSEYPFLLGLYPAMAQSFCILVEHVMEPLTKQLRPQERYDADTLVSLHQAKAVSSDVKYRDSKLIRPQPAHILPVLDPNPTMSTPQVVERFFYDQTGSQVLACDDVAQFGEVVMPYLRIAGVHLHRKAKLLSNIAQIGAADLVQSSARHHFWLTVLRSTLLPALSLLETNPAIVNDIHQLVACYDREQRYSLYGEWHTSLYKTVPELRVQLVKTEKETKGTLRRISKTNVKEFGRLLAKSSHSNPCIVLSIALNQIESYDNLVEVVIEASRYFTYLTFDVLAYILLTLLSNTIKRRLKEDGTSVAHWLQSLSSFTAKIYKRYSHLDPAPIVNYVAKQLKVDNAFDLIILQDLITEMGGVRPNADLSEEQLLGCSGGPLLKAEALSLINERVDVTATTAARLLQALEVTGLTIPFALMIGYQRGCSVYRVQEAASLVKLLANLQDTCHSILVQYLDLLSVYLGGKLDKDSLPSVSDMVSYAKLQPVVAFMIARPGVQAAVRAYNVARSVERKSQSKLTMEKLESDAQTAAMASPADTSFMDVVGTQQSAETQDVEMKDEKVIATQGESLAEPIVAETPSDVVPQPVLKQFASDIHDILPEETWQTLSIDLYTTFWLLDLYDLSVPVERYAKEIKAIRNPVKEIVDPDQPNPFAPRKRGLDQKRSDELVGSLQAEMKAQMQNNDYIVSQLTKQTHQWYTATSDEDTFALRSHQFVQHCLLPRSLVSPNDAVYCARFISFLHRADIAHFSLLHVYEELFGSHLATSVFTATEREAENLGKFLGETLKALNKLEASESAYDLAPLSLLEQDTETGKPKRISFEDFKSTWYKFHRSLWTCVKHCLSSKEYMQIRNILIVLEKMSAAYPHFQWVGGNIAREVDRLIANERREDLKIRALGYKAILKRQQTRWVEVPGKQGARTEEATKQSTPATSPSQLRASSAPFVPNAMTPLQTQEAPKSPAAERLKEAAATHVEPLQPSRDGQSPTSPKGQVPSSPRDINAQRASRTDRLREDTQTGGSRGSSRATSPRRGDKTSSDRPREQQDRRGERDRPRSERDLLRPDSRTARDERRSMPPPTGELEPGRLNGPPVRSGRPERPRGDDRLSRDWRLPNPEAQEDDRRPRQRREPVAGGESDSLRERDSTRSNAGRRDGRDRPSSREGPASSDEPRRNDREIPDSEKSRGARESNGQNDARRGGRETQESAAEPRRAGRDGRPVSADQPEARRGAQPGRSESGDTRRSARDALPPQEEQRRGDRVSRGERIRAEPAQSGRREESRKERPATSSNEPPSGPRGTSDSRTTAPTMMRENGKTYSVAVSVKSNEPAEVKQPVYREAQSLRERPTESSSRVDTPKGDAPTKPNQDASAKDSSSKADAVGPYVHPSRLASPDAPRTSTTERRQVSAAGSDGHAVHPSRLEGASRERASPIRGRGGEQRERAIRAREPAERDARRDGRQGERPRQLSNDGAPGRSGAGRMPERRKGGPDDAGRHRSPQRSGKRNSGYEQDGRARDQKRQRH